MDGQPVFVDPGTYCYTSDLEARNLFRSTAAHNTVMVDDQEINRIPPDEPFRLERDARVRVLEWHAGNDNDKVRLVAEHDGYGCLDRPVVHRRTVVYMPAEQTWLIEDLLQGEGEHAVEARWHFTPGMELDVQAQRHGLAIAVGGAQLDVAIADVDQWSYRSEQSWMSPAYGVKQAGRVLTIIAGFGDGCRLRVSAVRMCHEAGLELPDSIERDTSEPELSPWPADGDTQTLATAMPLSLIHPAQARWW